jgi:hypothetical protein
MIRVSNGPAISTRSEPSRASTASPSQPIESGLKSFAFNDGGIAPSEFSMWLVAAVTSCTNWPVVPSVGGWRWICTAAT